MIETFSRFNYLFKTETFQLQIDFLFLTRNCNMVIKFVSIKGKSYISDYGAGCVLI